MSLETTLPREALAGGAEPALVAHARRWVPLVSVALFLALAAYQGGKPLHLDNAEFAPAAEAVADTGVPIFYHGEEIGRTIAGENVRRQRRWSGAHLAEDQVSALYHPPLYVHVLAGWFLVFGKGALQARLLNALCVVLTCWLVVRLSRRLLGAASRTVDWALWPTVLLQAYTLQASGILDIDTSVYGPVLLALAEAAVAVGRRTGARLAGGELLLLAALVALAMWAKLTTVWLLAAALPLLLLPRLGLLRATVAAAGAVAIGGTIFLTTFLTYCRLMDLDPRDTFAFLLASFQRGGAVPPYAANFAASAPHVVKWTGLLPWIAAPLALTPWFARWLRLDRASRIQIRTLVGFALLGSVYYMAQTRTFGNAPFKYILVFWPLVLLPLALLTGGAAARALATGRAAAVGALVAVAAALAGLLAARVTRDEHLQLTGTVSPATLPMLALPGLLALAVAVRWASRGLDTVAALAWLAAATLQIGFQTGIALVQVRAPYSTDYDYGQLGLTEAIEYVRAHTTDHEVISAMKDLGYQARRRYIETYQPLYVSEERARELIRSWENGRVSLIVFTEGIGQDQAAVRPILAEWLAANAELVASPGHYRIYRPLRRPASDETTR